ncbi:nuclear transport factor 2 family protein [Saccharothrix sp. NPDC042600]|uniref:YybH family protein n=1 Tax=Saccharothrix TaxID=2071 RepID=UPI0033EEF3FF|nr:SgcJ/EcaC family oxidoreductase [Saccharothrix mutabilis subsp. capreolus]
MREIEELVARRAAAVRAGDAEALAADYLPEAVAFTMAPPLAHRGLTDPGSLREWFATFASAVDYEVRELAVVAEGDVAFCHSLNRMSALPQGYPERFDLWFRSTVCLRRVAGVWRIAHEHTSVPFHMDGSFSAAVGLTP